MISNTCKTAIKAVVFLCSRIDTDQKSGIKEVAAMIDANEHTVGKILQVLVKQNIIRSLKGPSGGFYITKAQQGIPIIQIVEAMDGKEVFKSCGLGLSTCSETRPCPIHHQYKEGRDIVEKLFRERKVVDLCVPVNQGVAYLLG